MRQVARDNCDQPSIYCDAGTRMQRYVGLYVVYFNSSCVVKLND